MLCNTRVYSALHYLVHGVAPDGRIVDAVDVTVPHLTRARDLTWKADALIWITDEELEDLLGRGIVSMGLTVSLSEAVGSALSLSSVMGTRETQWHLSAMWEHIELSLGRNTSEELRRLRNNRIDGGVKP